MLRALLDRRDGLLTLKIATQVVPESALRRAWRSGTLLRVLPGVYVDAELVRRDPADELPGSALRSAQPHPARRGGAETLGRLDGAMRRRAAIAYLDGRGALSQLTALDVWNLRRQPDAEPVHVDVPADSGLRGRPYVVVHHRRGFRMDSPQVVTRAGVPVVRLEQALVDSWPLLPAVERPAPVIRAVNDRRTTPQRVFAALRTAPKLAARAELRTLLDRLDVGCRSPLEIWGHDHVFNHPEMPRFQRQAKVTIGGRVMYLDVYAEAERVAFELDGATAHGDPRQREIDLRRDGLLATVGILVVRFAHRRLVHEVDEVRREVLAILATRRPGA